MGDILAEIIALPIICVLATPVILIAGFFGEDNYSKSVKEKYKKIFKLWKKYF